MKKDPPLYSTGFQNEAIESRSIRFYLTAPQTCPYLPDRRERKIFALLEGPEASSLNDVLSRAGFRRSHNIAYRPACDMCASCVSVRINTALFVPSKGQKRILARNQDLVRTIKRPLATEELIELLSTYVDARHGEGGMADMGHHDFADMIEESHINTYIFEYRIKETGQLVAAALVDKVGDGLSLVYSFFCPSAQKRSLGTFMILDAIALNDGRHHDETFGHNDFVYLGYWVKESRKMAYKAGFSGLEALGPQGWQRQERAVPPRPMPSETEEEVEA